MQQPDSRIGIDVGGIPVTIRPITPADRKIEDDFVRNLSDEARYYRFHSALKELTPEMLERFTQVNYPDDMALIATVENSGVLKEIAVARYARLPGRDAAEVAVVVANEWQGKGIGSRLLLELRDIAVNAGIHELYMDVLSENRRMIKLAQALGFHVLPMKDDYTTRQLGKTVPHES